MRRLGSPPSRNPQPSAARCGRECRAKAPCARSRSTDPDEPRSDTPPRPADSGSSRHRQRVDHAARPAHLIVARLAPASDAETTSSTTSRTTPTRIPSATRRRSAADNPTRSPCNNTRTASPRSASHSGRLPQLLRPAMRDLQLNLFHSHGLRALMSWNPPMPPGARGDDRTRRPSPTSRGGAANRLGGQP
jgi:hypothetical protein